METSPKSKARRQIQGPSNLLPFWCETCNKINEELVPPGGKEFFCNQCKTKLQKLPSSYEPNTSIPSAQTFPGTNSPRMPNNTEENKKDDNTPMNGTVPPLEANPIIFRLVVDVSMNGEIMGIHPSIVCPRPSTEDILSQILEWIMEHESDHDGAPPATQKAIDQLEKVKITPKLSEESEKNPCPICQEKYQIEDQVVKPSCHHMFHKKCLETWLNIHNTCPICRKEVEEKK